MAKKENLEAAAIHEPKAPGLRALDIAPAVASHHDTLAIVFEKLGRLEDAAAAYRRAVELAPEHPDFKESATC